MSEKISIVLADDHPILLSGLRNLIQSEGDFNLVGEATDGLSALALIRETQPNVAVIDISMPQLSGILLSRRVAAEFPSVRILLLTLHEDRAYVSQALEAGVKGYVLKRSASVSLVQAIRAVFVGGLYVDPAIANRMFDMPKRDGIRKKSGIGADLTERETEVLKLVALGFTSKEIGHRLDLGVKSVETYKARAIDKLGVRTRAEIVRYASGQGWLADA